MSSKYEIFSNRVEEHHAQPPGPPKATPPPRWEVVARLIEGTEIRRPAPTEGKYTQPGKWQIGGRYQRLEDGGEFDALLTVYADALVTAEALRSAFLLSGGDPRAIETRLHTIGRDVRNDPVSAEFYDDVEKTLRLLLGMEVTANG